MRQPLYILLLILLPLCTSASVQSDCQILTWGGRDLDLAQSLSIDSEGNVYVLGSFSRAVDMDPGPDSSDFKSREAMDLFLTKFDAQGNYQSCLHWPSAYDATRPIDVQVDRGGNMFVAWALSGCVDMDPGPYVRDALHPQSCGNCFVVKLNQGGDYQWAEVVNAVLWDMAIGPTGIVYLTGNCIAPYDLDLGPGQEEELDGGGSARLFIGALNTESNWDWEWRYAYGGEGKASGKAIAADADSNLYVLGKFEDTIDFDPGEGTCERVASGTQGDAFICKFGPTGDFQWVRTIEAGTCSLFSEAIATNKYGDIFAAVRFYGDAPDFGYQFGDDALSLSGIGVLVVKYDTDGLYRWSWESSHDEDLQSFLVTSIAVDESDVVYLAGSIWRGDDSDSTSTSDPASHRECQGAPLLVTLSGDGELVSTRSWYIEGWAGANDVAVGPDGRVCITGIFNGAIGSSARDDSQVHGTNGSMDCFLMIF